MNKFTFFKAFTLLNEADPGGAPGGPPGGGPDMGGPPGGMPMGGPPGGPPGMGGGDPMGGGPSGQPIEVKAIPAADVWKMLEKIVRDDKYNKFFEEINIAKKQQPVTHSKKQEKKSSLMR